MQTEIINLLHTVPLSAAVIISVLINIIISIFGFIPSVFITAANLVVFGFWPGTAISFIGETLGAVVAFWLYRKGLRRIVTNKLSSLNSKRMERLLSANNKDGFFMIIFLRILPFMPSGIVTFAAAISKVPLVVFAVASSIGKIPALLFEAYSVNEVTNWTLEGKVIMAIISITGVIYLVRRKRGRATQP
jgi:uncharacterized membrane protein YdjX (TVP38/TMEM64 family)